MKEEICHHSSTGLLLAPSGTERPAVIPNKFSLPNVCCSTSGLFILAGLESGPCILELPLTFHLNARDRQ